MTTLITNRQGVWYSPGPATRTSTQVRTMLGKNNRHVSPSAPLAARHHHDNHRPIVMTLPPPGGAWVLPQGKAMRLPRAAKYR